MTYKTYADVLRPSSKTTAILFDIALMAGAALILSLSSVWRIGWPVPITMQTFFVLFFAVLLGARRATIAVAAFLVSGLLGMPWYLGGALTGATGGYLIGFLVAAFVVGYLAESGMDRKYYTTVAVMVVGNIIIYVFGVLWLGNFLKQDLLMKGLIMFVPGDLIKIALATALLPTGWKLIEKLKK
ncbi:MAG: biotin transporter BioY [Spirochaetales bacterium]|nr:biotin transporter BioY [Spirochaetales bacterium]